MGIARDLLKQLKDQVKGQLMNRYGDRVVSSLADTSADAPNRFSAPKRDLYDKLQAEGQLAPDKDKY